MGGTGGGGSFAVFLWASGIHIRASQLVTGNGGDGGAAGSGGAGGVGGAGGAGGPYGEEAGQDDGGMGAKGGRGGDGGRGGHGGGGGGGPSIGVLLAGGSLPTLENNEVLLGSAGQGGLSQGQRGQDGVLAQTYSPQVEAPKTEVE
jgi:hypothetical protein